MTTEIKRSKSATLIYEVIDEGDGEKNMFLKYVVSIVKEKVAPTKKSDWTMVFHLRVAQVKFRMYHETPLIKVTKHGTFNSINDAYKKYETLVFACAV